MARLIGEELDAGQRPSGPYKGRIKAWKPAEFATAVRFTQTAVASWRNQNKPTVPNNIYPVLRTFYGDDKNQEFAEPRGRMKRAFDEAGGNTDIEPDPWTIQNKTMIEVASPAALSVNQPETDNANGSLRLPFTLQFRHAKARKITVLLDGKPVEAIFDLALKEAWLSVESPRWQPTEGGLFRTKGKGHPRIGEQFGNAVRIVPAPGDPCLLDEPFADEPAIPLEIENPSGDATVTLSVAADEAAFQHSISPLPRHLKQSDVIAAILRTATDRDAEDRIVIVSKTIQP